MGDGIEFGIGPHDAAVTQTDEYSGEGTFSLALGLQGIFRIADVTVDPAAAVLTVVLFFIDYSIIKLIMRSRNTYYSTIRMLGATRGDVRSLLFLDLFNVLNIAFALTVGAIYSVFRGYITVESTFVSDILTYLRTSDYAVIYAVLLVICFVISRKYAKALFTDSALSTLRQEA